MAAQLITNVDANHRAVEHKRQRDSMGPLLHYFFPARNEVSRVILLTPLRMRLRVDLPDISNAMQQGWDPVTGEGIDRFPIVAATQAHPVVILRCVNGISVDERHDCEIRGGVIIIGLRPQELTREREPTLGARADQIAVHVAFCFGIADICRFEHEHRKLTNVVCSQLRYSFSHRIGTAVPITTESARQHGNSNLRA